MAIFPQTGIWQVFWLSGHSNPLSSSVVNRPPPRISDTGYRIIRFFDRIPDTGYRFFLHAGGDRFVGWGWGGEKKFSFGERTILLAPAENRSLDRRNRSLVLYQLNHKD